MAVFTKGFGEARANAPRSLAAGGWLANVAYRFPEGPQRPDGRLSLHGRHLAWAPLPPISVALVAGLGSGRSSPLQKGLSRSDFAPPSSKTIARIERGDVEGPRGETLDAIARRLGVPPSEISSY